MAAAKQQSNNQAAEFKYDEQQDQQKLPFSPAAERNKQPIFEQLKQLLPATGIVLEIGSRHGQHCQYFGEQIHSSNLKETIQCKWQPTDYIDECFGQIEQRKNGSKVDIKSFILKSKVLSLLDKDWESTFKDDDIRLIYLSNVLHITEWQCSVGLFRGASAVLSKGGRVAIYGPFIINDGKHAAQNKSNLRFSESLKAKDASWGVRSLEDIVKLANTHQLEFAQKINMPANNYIIVFSKL